MKNIDNNDLIIVYEGNIEDIPKADKERQKI